MLPNIADPEMVIPELAYMVFPGFFAALLLSAIMAAIMSTSDSVLMQAGTILSRDIYQRFIDKNASQKKIVLVSRLCILIGGIVGVIVAIYEPPSVFALVVFAFGVLGNSFIIPYIASVYSRNTTNVGALSAMIAGGVTNVIWTVGGLEATTAIHPFLAGLLLSILGLVIGNRFGRTPSQKIQEAFEQAKGPRHLSRTLQKNISLELSPEAKNISEFYRKNQVDLLKG